LPGITRRTLQRRCDQPEIQQHELTVRLHPDIAGLDVAVQLVRRVQSMQTVAELHQPAAQARFIAVQRVDAAAGRDRNVFVAGPDEAGPIDAMHQLHRKKPAPLIFEQLAQLDQVRMMQRDQLAKLALQPQQVDGIRQT
jgi:hypothetical protein